MSEYTGSSYGSSTETQEGLESAAADFRRTVQDAASRMSSAAEQFIAMSEGLAAALEDARAAADRAQAAQRSAEEMQQRLQRDYGAVSDLVRNLQEKIAALATLAQPLNAEQPMEMPEPVGAYAGYGSQESEPSEATSSPSW